jgi:SnoaL-like domain
MQLTHIHAFLEAMGRKDLETMLTHMAEDIILKTPLIAEPFKGKNAIRPVVTALFKAVEHFEFEEMLQGPKHVAQFFRVTVAGNQLDGVDYWLPDEETGLIREMTVLWRPLPAIVEAQKRIASFGH